MVQMILIMRMLSVGSVSETLVEDLGQALSHDYIPALSKLYDQTSTSLPRSSTIICKLFKSFPFF